MLYPQKTYSSIDRVDMYLGRIHIDHEEYFLTRMKEQRHPRYLQQTREREHIEMTMNRINPRTAAWFLLAACATPLLCQFSNEPQKQLPPPAVNWTQEQDQKDMLHQLGIQALRPGRSGNESDANHAN